LAETPEPAVVAEGESRLGRQSFVVAAQAPEPEDRSAKLRALRGSTLRR